jgi:PAS domain S-box-containing protein
MKKLHEIFGKNKTWILIWGIILLQIVMGVFTAIFYFRFEKSKAEGLFHADTFLLSLTAKQYLQRGDYTGIRNYLLNYTKEKSLICSRITLTSRKGFKIFGKIRKRQPSHFLTAEKEIDYSYIGKAILKYDYDIDYIYHNIYLISIILLIIIAISSVLLIITGNAYLNRKRVSEELRLRNEELLKTNKTLKEEKGKRGKLEKESLEKTKFLQKIMEALKSPLYVINVLDYSISYANPASGLKPERGNIYCHWETHRSPEPCEGKEYQCPLKVIKETGEPTVVQHTHTDEFGNKRYFRIHAYPLFDDRGNFVQMIEYNVDITDLKEKEEELLKLKLGIDKLDEAVFITDRDGKINYVNLGFQKLYGYTPREVIGKTPRILKSGDLTLQDYKILWADLLGGKTHVKEVINKRKDGSLVTVNMSASPIVSEGKIIGFLSIQTDITEIVKARELLQKAKEEAEATNEMKTHFLKQIHEEIEVPVQSMLKYGELLIKNIKEKTAEEELNFIFENFSKNSTRIIRNTELVLNYSEIELGTYKPVFDHLNLHDEVVLEVFQKLKPEAEKKGLDFEIIRKTEDVSVLGDIKSLRNIYLNLIDNAIKYTNKGGITVSISVEDSHIVSEIMDTGVGMSQEFLKKIFKPFSIEAYEKGRKSSIGMGLALVKKYCELNNINLQVESKKNKGSTFRLIFN